MPYREKRIYSGAMLEIERRHCTMSGRVIGREAKSRATGKAQERINLRNAQLRLMRLMCTNFEKGDLHITLTMGPNRSWGDTAKQIAKFLRKLRSVCQKKLGRALKYILVREDRGVRPHWHLVCNRMPITPEELATLWPFGLTGMQSLDGNPDYGWLARYLLKQDKHDEKNHKRWSASKNLEEPVMTPPKVLKRKALSSKPRVPKEYYVLSYYHNATANGYEWEYLVAIRYDRCKELPLEVQELLGEWDGGAWADLSRDGDSDFWTGTQKAARARSKG